MYTYRRLIFLLFGFNGVGKRNICTSNFMDIDDKMNEE